MASIGAQDAIKYIYENNFTMGSHTVNHVNFSAVSNDVVEQEISGVQTTIATILDEPDFKATLSRAPYGIPYEPGAPFASDVTRIAPIAAKYGVHIGWSIDSNDWKCKDDQDAAGGVQCVKDNVMNQVKGGSWGIILFHAIYHNTPDALSDVIDELVREGYHFVSVEDIVKAKYGVVSAELIRGK
ncbi:glycoside hydrolase/deacetylase [Saitoella complicata NRRL Y-17804]|nr:glycoside hydrolase/deacetylase [Saitoella complicata NRRL Y-17804]ODQ55281.1 glycoside hydrolase/deacetylase [Saitoella complicata NRRL Y-17804]